MPRPPYCALKLWPLTILRVIQKRSTSSAVVCRKRLNELMGASGQEYPSVQLQLRCVTAEQACALGDCDVTCAVAVLDMTQCDEHLALFAGRLQGWRVPCIVVYHTAAEAAARRLGLNNRDLVAYTSMDKLFLPDSVLQRELLRAVPQTRIHEEFVYRFWFPRETRTIWVVCPQIHEPGEFAELSSPDYTYLDNLGDTDALLEVMVFLSQYYPNATIERFSARDLPNGHTSGNLVVIGGPGSADDISNEICREMMKSMGSHVSYSSDCEQMIVARQCGQTVELQAEYRTDGQASAPQEPLGVRCDPGYFARFANPLNESATVVLINGVHTTGVLGAAKVFGERREALRNFQAALASGAEPGSFECHFDVQVVNRYVRVPEVDPRHIWSLGRAESTVQSMATNAHGHKFASDIRTSATILFIAGDRGLNQLQVPNEYDAIQGALHACKHRDIISLGNPILAATRGKLAEAYRQRPRALLHESSLARTMPTDRILTDRCDMTLVGRGRSSD